MCEIIEFTDRFETIYHDDNEIIYRMKKNNTDKYYLASTKHDKKLYFSGEVAEVDVKDQCRKINNNSPLMITVKLQSTSNTLFEHSDGNNEKLNLLNHETFTLNPELIALQNHIQNTTKIEYLSDVDHFALCITDDALTNTSIVILDENLNIIFTVKNYYEINVLNAEFKIYRIGYRGNSQHDAKYNIIRFVNNEYVYLQANDILYENKKCKIHVHEFSLHTSPKITYRIEKIKLPECKICFEEMNKKFVINCGHSGFCSSCVMNMNICPYCETKIVNRIPLFE